MKEELYKRAAMPPLDKKPIQQIYTDLLASMSCGKSFNAACKEFSLDPMTIWRDLLPSEGFRKEWEAFMLEERTKAQAALASLRDTALGALEFALLDYDRPDSARLAYKILRHFAGPGRDRRKRPTKGRASTTSRVQKK